MQDNNEKHSDLIEFLNQALSETENSEIEFKHAHGGFPGSFWSTYSSFANTDGGSIIFGVKEKKGEFKLDPINADLANELITTFWKQVRSKDQVNLCLLSNQDIKTLDYNGSKIIIFNIPRAHYTERPVYVGRDPFEGTYKRGHEGDYKLRRIEVNQLFADANIDIPADSRLLEDFTMEDIDLDSLNQYRQRMAVANPDHVWLGYDNKTFLQHLGGYRIDRKTKKEGLTVAGLLMFGKWTSIRDVAGMPTFGVDYREYTDLGERWSHRIFSDGSWEGNLFQFFYRVLPRLQRAIDSSFVLSGTTRLDNQRPGHKAIREALVNCIIHASYGSNTRVVVSYYPKEIIFSNPGNMLVSQQQFFTGGQSVCRNQSLQVMFSLLGAGDQAGSGGDVIMHGWKNENLRTPYIVESGRPDTVELFLPLESMLSDEVKKELEDLFGEEVLDLDRSMLTILALATSQPINNTKLQYVLELHASDITGLLSALVKKKYLLPTGLGRGTTYTLNRAYAKANDKANDKAKTKADDGISSDSQDNNSVISENKDKAEHLAKDKAKDKAQRDKTIIIEELKKYCSIWRKSSEMARYVGKTPHYISRSIIPSMLGAGILVREYPDNPKHPGQRYRAISKN